MIIVLLVIALCSGGCLTRVINAGSGPGTVGEADPAGTDYPQTTGPAAPGETGPDPEITSQPVATLSSIVVREAPPIQTPDPYPVLHGTRLNETARYRFIERKPEFEKTYVLRGNATGILVTADQGPITLAYRVKPQNDCMLSPDSCRGDLERPVQRPYLTITVRDNETQEIVALDGYGREYSSDTGNYDFIVTGENADGLTGSGGSEGSNTVSPGPRKIKIYRSGTFHITLEGNYLDTDLSIIAGPTLDPLEAEESVPVPRPEPGPEEEGEWA